MCKLSMFDEPARLWRESLLVAETDTTCDMCKGPIACHEQYALLEYSDVPGPEDGAEERAADDIVTEEYCIPCQRLRDEFFDAHGGDRTNGSVVPDLLRECVDDADDEDGARWQKSLDEIAARRTMVPA